MNLRIYLLLSFWDIQTVVIVSHGSKLMKMYNAIDVVVIYTIQTTGICVSYSN